VAIIDDLKALAPVAEPPEDSRPSWVKDLIDKRYQPKTERIKRAPQGFDFKREPFDPSSYYRQLGSLRDISRAATNVTRQEVANREQAEAERAFAENQAAMNSALQGVNPNFTYNESSGGGGSYDGATHNYHLKGVSSTTSAAANYFGGKYGIKTIGGRGPGSVPGSDHPKGRATDFMINNIKNGKKVGDALANDVISHYKAWNVKYVIWNRYIWQPGRGWHKYNGPSDHTDHVHVSYNR
jgi:hypothetical protein